MSHEPLLGVGDHLHDHTGGRIIHRCVEGPRVIASIMPRVVPGNTNARVIMIADKGAELILRAAA